MLKHVIRHWPLVIALAVLYSVVVVMLFLVLRTQDGHLTYTLDDPYIHMAIAKHLVRDGVWGVTPYHFNSASSSPVWVMILALVYAILGVSEITPFVLNLMAATSLLVIVYALFRTYRVSSNRSAMALIVIIFLTPLPWLIFCGHEHILHAVLAVAFAGLFAKVMSQDRYSFRSWDVWVLGGLAMVLPLVRYEALLMLIVVCGLALLRGWWRLAVYLGVLAVIPIAVFGMVSVRHGEFMLPNPVVLKSNLLSIPHTNSPIAWLKTIYNNYLAPAVISGRFFRVQVLPASMLILAGLWAYVRLASRTDPLRDAPMLILGIFVGTGLLHAWIIPGATSDLHRYFDYLIALGICALVIVSAPYTITPHANKLTKARVLQGMAALGLVIFYGSPLYFQGYYTIKILPNATHNVYFQQYQMARFVHTYYEGQEVILNDIGAVDYLADIHLLDVVGLGTGEVAQQRYRGLWRSNWLDAMAVRRHSKIAIVYRNYVALVNNGVPRDWIEVGEWTIPNRVTAGNSTVAFYAVDPAEADALVCDLMEFSPRLPPAVQQSGPYVASQPCTTTHTE